MATGQTNVKAYNRHLASLIEMGKAKPSFIVSHHLSLEQAPDAYQHFDAREQGWTKVVLKPQLAATDTKRSGRASVPAPAPTHTHGTRGRAHR